MKHIKWIVMTLTACMLLSVAGFAQAATEKALFDVTSLGIIQGDENGDYKLDSPLTRAEFMEALLKFLQYDEAAKIADVQKHFTDVPADAWYARTVSFGVQMNLMNGYGDGTFGPDNAISLEEAVKNRSGIAGIWRSGKRARRISDRTHVDCSRKRIAKKYFSGKRFYPRRFGGTVI